MEEIEFIVYETEPECLFNVLVQGDVGDVAIDAFDPTPITTRVLTGPAGLGFQTDPGDFSQQFLDA